MSLTMCDRTTQSKPRRFSLLLAAGLMLLSLSGCGEQFPVLTQEEYDLIVDYSAGVLSKYSTGNGDKLTKIPPPEPEEAEETDLAEAPEDEKPAPAAKPAPAKPVKEKTPEPEPEPEEPEPVAQETPDDPDAAIIVNNGDREGTGDEPDEGAEEPAIVTPEETGDSSEAIAEAEIGGDDLLQKLQSGVKVGLNGYYVLNSYPEGAGNSNLAINAEPGKKLLILSFSLTNETAGAIDVDYLSKAPSFTLYINGEPVSRNMTTLLDNEMSTYAGSVESGETKGAVLCFQIKEEQAKSIDTLSMRVNCFGEEQMLSIE